jgi:hypothetical protein
MRLNHELSTEIFRCTGLEAECLINLKINQKLNLAQHHQVFLPAFHPNFLSHIECILQIIIITSFSSHCSKDLTQVTKPNTIVQNKHNTEKSIFLNTLVFIFISAMQFCYNICKNVFLYIFICLFRLVDLALG